MARRKTTANNLRRLACIWRELATKIRHRGWDYESDLCHAIATQCRVKAGVLDPEGSTLENMKRFWLPYDQPDRLEDEDESESFLMNGRPNPGAFKRRKEAGDI